jgi:hypothetical protein
MLIILSARYQFFSKQKTLKKQNLEILLSVINEYRKERKFEL